MSEDEQAAGRAPANADPLEEQTQPLSKERGGDEAKKWPADPATDGPAPDPETTILSPAQAPPVPIDDTPTSVLPADGHAPEPEPEPEPEPAAGPPGERALEPERTGEPPRSDDAVLEQQEPAGPERPDEAESTERMRATPPEDAATMLSVESAAETVVGDSSTRATLAPSSSLHPMLLERVEPSLGRGERMRLDASHWRLRLGRAEHNDVRLYTASASREHAEIAGNEAGDWILTPSEGKTVLIDGEPVSGPISLEVGMNLVMGGDQLRCVTEGLERVEMSAQTAADGLDDAGKGGLSRIAGIAFSWWLIAAVALVGLGLIAFAWLGE